MKLERRAFLWLAAGTVLMLFSNGRWNILFAAWIYPIFYLRFMHKQRPAAGFIIVALISALGNTIMWWKMLPFPNGIYFFLMGLMGVIFSFSFLADRLLAAHLKGFTSTLVFPAVWCTTEYILSFTPKGTWLSLAYTQTNNLMLIQTASITGIWGIIFLVTWFASTVNWAANQKFEWQRIRRGIFVFMTVFAIGLLYGITRLNFLMTDINTVRVASIVDKRQINENISACKWTDAEGVGKYSTDVENNLLEKTQESARAGAKIVLWQEAAGFIPKKEEGIFIERAMKVARQERIYLLMTLWSIPEDYPEHKVENELVIINPEGIREATYIKNNPAPSEPILKGDGSIPVVQTAYGKIAPAICADGDYPAFIRQAGQNKVDIMFIPANDWKSIDPLHTYMSIMRAVENGFSLVHPVGQGLSVATDSRGRIISSMDFYTTNEQVMYSDVPVQHTSTIYAQTGDAFAWLCIAGLITIVISTIFRRHTTGKIN